MNRGTRGTPKEYIFVLYLLPFCQYSSDGLETGIHAIFRENETADEMKEKARKVEILFRGIP